MRPLCVSCLLHTLAVMLLLLSGCAATTGGGGARHSAKEAKASVATAIARFRDELPATANFFDNAYGYAVFPRITRGAAGIGGVWGRGVLIEQGEAVSEIKVRQVIHGITFGGEVHREVIFFQDAATLEEFRQGTLEWRGRAGVAVGAWGATASPGYTEGVAVFAQSRLGLMVDASVAAAGYSFRPIRRAGGTAGGTAGALR